MDRKRKLSQNLLDTSPVLLPPWGSSGLLERQFCRPLNHLLCITLLDIMTTVCPGCLSCTAFCFWLQMTPFFWLFSPFRNLLFLIGFNTFTYVLLLTYVFSLPPSVPLSLPLFTGCSYSTTISLQDYFPSQESLIELLFIATMGHFTWELH